MREIIVSQSQQIISFSYYISHNSLYSNNTQINDTINHYFKKKVSNLEFYSSYHRKETFNQKGMVNILSWQPVIKRIAQHFTTIKIYTL